MNKNIMVNWMKNSHLSIPKILLTKYHEIGIKQEELIILLHVYMAQEEGALFPTPKDLAKNLPNTEEECSQVFSQLLSKGFLQISQYADENGLLCEYLSLDGLWDKLVSSMILEEEKSNQVQKQTEERNIYTIFEQEFSRPLSPIEYETLTMWLDDDKHTAELIKAALKEAVVSSKLSFRYIDRILFEWKKNGIKTLDQAKAYGEKFRKFQQQKPREVEPRKKATSFPAYNWLEQ